MVRCKIIKFPLLKFLLFWSHAPNDAKKGVTSGSSLRNYFCWALGNKPVLAACKANTLHTHCTITLASSSLPFYLSEHIYPNNSPNTYIQTHMFTIIQFKTVKPFTEIGAGFCEAASKGCPVNGHPLGHLSGHVIVAIVVNGFVVVGSG